MRPPHEARVMHHALCQARASTSRVGGRPLWQAPLSRGCAKLDSLNSKQRPHEDPDPDSVVLQNVPTRRPKVRHERARRGRRPRPAKYSVLHISGGNGLSSWYVVELTCISLANHMWRGSSLAAPRRALVYVLSTNSRHRPVCAGHSSQMTLRLSQQARVD